jgi:outer membrane protein TolC
MLGAMRKERLPARAWRSALGVVALALALAPAAHAADAPTSGLRLDDAVQLALSKNERAKIADEQVLVADAAVRRAHTGFLPTVTANGSDVLRPPVDRNGVEVTPANTINAGGSISQPIVNASAWPLLRQAERLLDAQRATSTDQKHVLAFDAATAFFGVLTVEQVLQAAQRRVDTSKRNLDDAQARVQAQLNSSNDVTRAQLNVAAAEQELATDEGNVRRAYLNLAFVLATPVAGPLVAPAPTLSAAAAPVPQAEPLVAAAYARRLDLVASKHNARAAHLFADEPLLRLVPTLGVTGAITTTSNTPATGRATDETLTGTLTWILYDAGARYADKRSRDAQANIADLQVLSLVRAIETDVRTALSSLTAAQGAFKAAGDSVAAAQRSVSETETLYRQGLAKALELTDATDSRFNAEVAYANAQLAMALAYLALREALGLEPLGTVLS